MDTTSFLIVLAAVLTVIQVVSHTDVVGAPKKRSD